MLYESNNTIGQRVGETYVVAGCKPWNRRVFHEVISEFPGKWHFVGRREELSLKLLSEISPRYVFLLHWSWKVPSEIVENYECVCFHMADVPYGRGGSPLQNLIVRGHRHTKLTALRMVEDYDAGPVYLKEELCLEGNAEQIYIRATYLAAQMIRRIIEKHPEPQLQTGKVATFKRRKASESRIPESLCLEALYDFIRMLDAEGYPRAFIEYGGFRFEFSRATLYDARIVADVTVTRLAHEL